MGGYRYCEYCGKRFRRKGLSDPERCTCILVNTKNLKFAVTDSCILSLNGKKKKKDKETGKWTISCLQDP